MLVNDVRIATIIDCEGWISLEKINNSGVGVVLTLGVGNTNHVLTDWLKEIYGGSVYKRHYDGNAKDSYVWKVNSRKAKEILEAALPYMLLKTEQAKLAIHFQNNMQYTNAAPSKELIEYMQSLKRQMNRLNRKGKAPAETERIDTEQVKRQSEHSEETGVSAIEIVAPA